MGRLASPCVTPEVESARRDWEDAYRRLEDATRDPALAGSLLDQLEAVTAELRKRVGATFTLRELEGEYRRAEAWSRDAVAERAAAPGWPRTLSIVEGAAFHLYSRGATDYEP